ncbi:plancitoxin-1-like [Crassostrea virginica]
MEVILASLFFLIFFNDVDCSLSCKNPRGKDVEWFIMYKLPMLDAIKTQGTEFYYIDKSLNSFEYYNEDITKKRLNPLYRTLQPIHNKHRQPVSYAMYNDQPPVGNKAQGCGHSKGVYAFDRKQGFWIVSSVPNFPAPSSNGYKYNESQFRNAQTLICITLKSEYLDDIKSILNITIPYIYDGKHVEKINPIPSTIRGRFSLETVGETAFEVFAKSLKFKKDIYNDFMGPSVGELLVKTWTHTLPKAKWVKKVNKICFDDHMKFNSGVDHSKWAVSVNTDLLCIGDINREEKQFKRGGLAICFNGENVAKAFRNLYDNCSKEQKGVKKYGKRSKKIRKPEKPQSKCKTVNWP